MNRTNTDKRLDEILNRYVSNYNLDVLGFRQSGQETVKRAFEALINEAVREARIDELRLQAKYAMDKQSSDEIWRHFYYKVEDYINDRLAALNKDKESKDERD